MSGEHQRRGLDHDREHATSSAGANARVDMALAPGKHTLGEALPALDIEPHSAFDAQIAIARTALAGLAEANAASDIEQSRAAAAQLRSALDAARYLLGVAQRRGREPLSARRAILADLEASAAPVLATASNPRPAGHDAAQAERFIATLAGPHVPADTHAVAETPVQIAERGVADASEPLPHVQTLQALFGRHDLSRIKAQIGGPAAQAARAIGARAYAIGERVGFASLPDLHEAAHEAVHVIDHAPGVARKAELDAGTDDPYERRADAIADAVVRGERVEAQLDRATTSGRAMAAVHRKRESDPSAPARPNALSAYLSIHEIDLRDALVVQLRGAGWPDPAPDVRFADRGERLFTANLVNAIRPRLTDADLMPRLVSPGDLVERFHRYVDLHDAKYSPHFGMALAQLVQWAARDALVERVGPRYRKLWASRFEPPDADELRGPHPMDAVVAEALTVPGVVDVFEVPAVEPDSPTVSSSPAVQGRSKAVAHGRKAMPKADSSAPTVQQLMDIERDIGVRLEAIRHQVAGLGFDDELRGAYDARAARVQLLADTDAATRTRYLPVLQFQHTQLIAIADPLAELVPRYWAVRFIPEYTLTTARRAERDEIRVRIETYVGAAATSHDKEKSTAILRRIELRARKQARDEMDAGQVAATLDTRDAINSTPYPVSRTTVEGVDTVSRARQAMLDGTPAGRSKYEQRKAITLAGETSLNARMHSAEYALEQLRTAAVAVFGDMDAMRRMFPNLRPLPDVILDVKDHLTDVSRTWKAAIADHTVIQDDPHAPDDWADWRARGDALPIAEQAFAKIAGDQDLVTFLNDAATTIRHQAMINAIVDLAVALLISLAVGMGAAALGARAAAAIATEESALRLRILALAADVSVNVTINTAVQLAMSPARTRNADGSERGDARMVVVAVVENALMELFTRGLMKPVRMAHDGWVSRAKEISALPNLSKDERALFSSFDFAGTQLTAELLGGMSTQWAAHRLIEVAHKSGEEVSEPFALTVLQQGAAVGLGKFFHGKLEAWKAHRNALAKTRLGQLPEAQALFAAREAFYARAKALEESLSPDPTAMQELAHDNEVLLAQERALVASQPNVPDNQKRTNAVPRSVEDSAHSDASVAATGTSREAVSATAGDAPQVAQPTAVDTGARAHAPHEHTRSSAAHADGAPAPRTDAPGTPMALGERIASSVGGRYLGEGAFEIGGGRGPRRVQIERKGRLAVRRHGEDIVLEIPRGVAEPELERMVAGKLAELAQLDIEHAIGPTDHEPTLSAHDHGLIAELRVLRRQAQEAQERGAQGADDAARVRTQIDAIERKLRMHDEGSTSVQRTQMVEAQIRVQEGAAARAEEARRLGGKRGHPGIEVHSHFMGIVDAEVFRQRAAAASGANGGKSWLPLFERIRTMAEAEKQRWRREHPHAAEADFKSTLHHQRKGERIDKRSNTGDAMDIVDAARKQIKELEDRATATNTPDADRAAYLRAAEYLAEEASRTALSSTPETPFDGAYVLRGALVETTFGGGERRPGETEADAEQRQYDDYIREALLRLAAEGIHYSEQSSGIGKLGGALHPERIERVLQQLIAEGKLQPGQIEVKMLTMLKTAHFGERDPRLPSVGKSGSSRAAYDHDVGKALGQVERGGPLGIDIGAPEHMSFTPEGMRRWTAQLIELSNLGKATGEAQLARPHVGEGAMDTKDGLPYHTDKNRHVVGDEPSHYARARHNLEMMLDALEALPPGVLDPTYLVVRFGHAAHATPAQAARMKRLGVIAEVNLGSNVTTGSISQTQGIHGRRTPTDRFDDHSLPTLVYYDVATLLSTDGADVMHTTLAEEYGRARVALEGVLSGKLPVRISAADAMVGGKVRGREVAGRPDERDIHVWEMTSDELGRFERGYKKLYGDAETYHRGRPKGTRGRTVDVDAYTGIATRHRLKKRFGHASFEGDRSAIDAATADYRDAGYLVTQSDADPGALTVLTSPDQQVTLTLTTTIEESKR